MAQATSTATTSRRIFLMGAAVAAIALPPAIAESVAMIDWDAHENELRGASNEADRLTEAVAVASRGLDGWKARNPFPDEPEYDSHNARIDDFRPQQKRESDWTARHINAVRQSRSDALKVEWLETMERLEALRDAASLIECRGLADLKLKARLTRYDGYDGAIARTVAVALSKM